MMKNTKAFTRTLFALALLGSLNTPAALAAQSHTQTNNIQAAQLQLNAQYSAAAAMEENLNEVVATINASVKKELTLSMSNDQSLDIALAKRQAIKDDKVSTAQGE